MLNALAAHLLDALRGRSAASTLRLGEPLTEEELPLVFLRVERLKPEASGPSLEEGSGVGLVTQRRRAGLSPSVDPCTFALPDRDAVVLEVYSPPGRRVYKGDQFEVHDGALRFYSEPDSDVVVELAEAPRRGWQSRVPVTIEVALGAIASEGALAEEHLMNALGAVLEVLGEEDVYTLTTSAPRALQGRFLLDTFRVEELRSAGALQGEAAVERVDARLSLVGHLEMSVTWTKPTPAGVIERIHLGGVSGRTVLPQE